MDNNNSDSDKCISKPEFKPSSPEPFDINISDLSGYSTLSKSIGGIVVLLLAIYLLTRALINLSPYLVSVELENRIFKNTHKMMFKNAYLSKPLTQFAKKLVPENKQVEVFRVDLGIANAFCFLGNKLFITNELLANIQSENELAFIISHELGHAKNRDNLKNLSVYLVTGMLFSFVDFLKPTSQYLALGYSRSMEAKADKFALESTRKMYGHTNGVETFFERLKKLKLNAAENSFAGEYLSTHPAIEKRIELIKKTQSLDFGRAISRKDSYIFKKL